MYFEPTNQTSFNDLDDALTFIDKNPNCEVYGVVKLNGKYYCDDEIKELIDRSITGWCFLDEESSICIVLN